MRVLVTGADSFVGSYLIPLLQEQGDEVMLIGADVSALQTLYDNSKAVSFIGLSQADLFAEMMAFKPEVVVHLAAHSTPNDDYSDYEKLVEANLLFLGKVLTALVPCPPKLFVNTGSSFEYFKGDGVLDPAYLYTATKTASRYILKYYASAYNFRHCTVCPYSVYGGIDTRKKVLDIIRESLDADEPMALSPGQQVMDFIHIEDLARLYASIVKKEHLVQDEQVFHAGSGQGRTLQEVALVMERISEKKTNIAWGALPYRQRDVMQAIADITLQKNVLDWQPTITFEKGIKMYLETHEIL